MNTDLPGNLQNYLEPLSNDNSEIKCVTSVFTIFFEDPFWIGILEENYNGINSLKLIKAVACLRRENQLAE